MGWQTLELLGVLLGLLACSATPLVALPWYLRRVRLRRNGRFSIFLLLATGFFFLPSVPNLFFTLGDIGNVLVAPNDDSTFAEFLLGYVVRYVDLWFLWPLAAVAAVMLGYRLAQPPRTAEQ